MAMLDVKGLRVNYGPIQAIKGIDFHVNQGEILTLIGANGAGKSTILRTIVGLNRASAGTITFMDQVINKYPGAKIVKAGISLSPEGRRIFPKLTVHENIRLGAFTRKDIAEINKDFERVYNYFPRLRDRANQQGGTLSGGEQQMLAIARALMSRPTLLLLDEPSLGLAPLLVEQIFHIIKEIHEEGTTVMLVEQKAYMALKLAQWGYVLENGELALEGTTEELLKNDYVKNAYLG